MNISEKSEIVRIRLGKVADIEGVWTVHTRAIRELCSRDYSPEQIEAWAGPRQPQGYMGPIEAGRLFVADRSGEVIGFGEFHEDRREICAIYVRPDCVRVGIGRALFERVAEELRAKMIRHAWLDASLTSVDFYAAQSCKRGGIQEHRLGGTSVFLPCVRMDVEL